MWASSWAKAAARYQTTTAEPEPIPALLDFVPQVSPHLVAPVWLAPLVAVLERSIVTPTRVVVNVPPQHGKSETILHFLALLARYHGDRLNAYATYATDFARTQSRKCRRYALEAGVRIDTAANRLEEWRTLEGGGLLATGIGGPLTGHGVSGVLVVDDAVKNREEAESPSMREKTWEWFTDVAMTRVHPGASVVVVATRWHVDDLPGRLIDDGWELVKLPALTEDGEALAPQIRPASFLAEQRRQIGEYSWASLYMQEPRPRGDAVFNAPSMCRLADIPPVGRQAIGMDGAYTKQTRADYSGAVVLREHAGDYYVTHIERFQERPEEAGRRLAALAARNPGTPWRWHIGSTELGMVAFLRRCGVPLGSDSVIAAKTDKFVRAQPAAAAWNAGKVHVPSDAPWTKAFLDEVMGFSGVGDKHDDMVDMLASAFDALQATGTVETFGERSMRSAREHY